MGQHDCFLVKVRYGEPDGWSICIRNPVLMTATDFIWIALGIFALTFIWLLADAEEVRRVGDCIHSIDLARCPKCKGALGDSPPSVTREKLIKFTGGGPWPRGKSDHPSRLVSVVCPHCAMELDFRLDGSLFSSDHAATCSNESPRSSFFS
jgi:hypothetical protein